MVHQKLPIPPNVVPTVTVNMMCQLGQTKLSMMRESTVETRRRQNPGRFYVETAHWSSAITFSVVAYGVRICFSISQVGLYPVVRCLTYCPWKVQRDRSLVAKAESTCTEQQFAWTKKSALLHFSFKKKKIWGGGGWITSLLMQSLTIVNKKASFHYVPIFRA